MIDCIIMAGGRATRFDFTQFSIREKPLIPLNSYPMIDYIISAIKRIEFVDKIIVATSPHTSNTFDLLTQRNDSRLTVVRTVGHDYHSDLQDLILHFNLTHTLVLTADIPTLFTTEGVDFLHSFIHAYFESKVPAYSAMCGDKYLGVNILDGDHIGEDYIDQKEYQVQDSELLLNINRFSDYSQLLNKKMEFLNFDCVNEIILIRHTQVHNPDKICYGQTGIPLKETFNQEAKQITDQIDFSKIHSIYSSPSSRCLQLANFLKYKTMHIIEDSRLMELNFGSWEGQTYSKLETIPEFKIWADNFVEEPTLNGESYIAMEKRVLEFYHEIKNTHKDGKKIVIVTHGGVIRIILSQIRSILLKDSFSISIDYGSIHQIYY